MMLTSGATQDTRVILRTVSITRFQGAILNKAANECIGEVLLSICTLLLNKKKFEAF